MHPGPPPPGADELSRCRLRTDADHPSCSIHLWRTTSDLAIVIDPERVVKDGFYLIVDFDTDRKSVV